MIRRNEKGRNNLVDVAMKVLKTFLLIMVVLQLSNKVCSAQKLYFLMGHPFPDFEIHGDPFPSEVLFLENDSLKSGVCNGFIDKTDWLQTIKTYPDQKAIIISKKKFKSTDSTVFIHLNYAEKLVVNEFNVNMSNSSCMENLLFDLPNDGLYICAEWWNRKKKIIINQGISLDGKPNKLFEAEDFNNVIIDGYNGLTFPSNDFLRLKSKQGQNKLYIPETNDINQRPGFKYLLPSGFEVKEDNFYVVGINNDSLLVIYTNITESTTTSFLMCNYLILNKNSNKWDTFQLKGNRSSIKYFGKYLTGTIIADNESSGLPKISPGKEFRRKENSNTGVMADERFNFLSFYCPGILYLYNVETKEYYEWTALENGIPQGDSEILFIQDEMVYYRINDKIYSAPIVSGKKLGEPNLLVQDERVPDIHWAFISGE